MAERNSRKYTKETKGGDTHKMYCCTKYKGRTQREGRTQNGVLRWNAVPFSRGNKQAGHRESNNIHHRACICVPAINKKTGNFYKKLETNLKP